MSVVVPPKSRTEMTHNFGIPASEDNPASYAPVGCNDTKLFGPLGKKVSDFSRLGRIDLGLGLDSHGPVPVVLGK